MDETPTVIAPETAPDEEPTSYINGFGGWPTHTVGLDDGKDGE